MHLSQDLGRCHTMPKTVYLANPYGFSTQQKELLLPPIVTALEELGLEVWEPFSRNNQEDFDQRGWAYRVGQQDFRDVVESDATFAIVNGVPPDEGVSIGHTAPATFNSSTYVFSTPPLGGMGIV